MLQRRIGVAFIVSTIIGVSTFSGCSNQTATPPPQQGSTPTVSSGGDSVSEALAKLSDADRAAALKQEVCPVTGAKLGSMDTPPKVTVEGKEVFLCCSGCEDKLRGDPATYLAKLKKE